MRILFSLLVFMLLLPGMAHAQTGSNLPANQNQTVNDIACAQMRANAGSNGISSEVLGLNGYSTSLQTVTVCPCAPRPGLWLERIIYCFAAKPDGVIYVAVKRFIDSMGGFYWAIVGGAIFASMMIYGYKLVTGAFSGLKRESMIFILKIAAVSAFFANFGVLHGMVIDITYGLGNLAAGMLNDFGDVCEFPAATAGPATTVPTLWAQFDCMFDKLLGISGNFLMAGMLGFVVSLFLSSALGVVIFMGSLYIFITLLLAAMRAVWTYLSAILSISFLLLLAPIFVPLVLFSASYSSKFNKYGLMLLGHMMVPMLLYLMIIVALMILKYSVFIGPVSLFGAFSDSQPTQIMTYSEAMNAGAGTDITKFYKQKKATLFTMHPSQEAVTANPNQPNPVTTGPDQGVIGEGPQSQTIPPDPNSYEADVSYTTVDEDALAAQLGAGDRESWLTGTAMQVLATAIIAYMAFNMMGAAPKMAGQIASSAFSAKHVTQNQMLGQATVQKGLSVAQQASRAKLSGEGDFRASAAGALRNSYDKMAGNR